MFDGGTVEQPEATPPADEPEPPAAMIDGTDALPAAASAEFDADAAAMAKSTIVETHAYDGDDFF